MRSYIVDSKKMCKTVQMLWLLFFYEFLLCLTSLKFLQFQKCHIFITIRKFELTFVTVLLHLLKPILSNCCFPTRVQHLLQITQHLIIVHFFLVRNKDHIYIFKEILHVNFSWNLLTVSSYFEGFERTLTGCEHNSYPPLNLTIRLTT